MSLFKSAKYKFFEKKVEAVQRTIWELDFKIAKSNQVREGVRQDRERAIEALQRMNTNLAAETDKGKKKELQKEVDTLTQNVTRYEAQMRMMDKQINGFIGSETEEPIVGLREEIQSYAELREMYKQFLTTL